MYSDPWYLVRLALLSGRALRLKIFSAQHQKHTTWVITKDSKVTTYWNRFLCFWFARSVSILTRFKSVRRTWHFFHKQYAKWLFYFCHQWCVFLAYSCINLQFNFQQSQLPWNIYKHIFIVSCILATMPAWQFVFFVVNNVKKNTEIRTEKCASICHRF